MVIDLVTKGCCFIVVSAALSTIQEPIQILGFQQIGIGEGEGLEHGDHVVAQHGKLFTVGVVFQGKAIMATIIPSVDPVLLFGF
jgi:hypothetical protein